MSALRITKKTREEYQAILNSCGELKLYRYIIGNGIVNKALYDHPEVIILDQADGFFALYRSSGQQDYFTIGKILRRAAHKLYREFCKIDDEYPKNRRFLSIVRR